MRTIPRFLAFALAGALYGTQAAAQLAIPRPLEEGFGDGDNWSIAGVPAAP